MMADPPRDSAAGFEQLLEYRQELLARLEAQPGEFAATAAAIPGPAWHTPRDRLGRSLLAIAAHLRDVEAKVFLPRIQRMLREDTPALTLEAGHDEASAGARPDEPLTAILEGWSQARAEVVNCLRPLGPADWSRKGFYPPTGKRTVQWWAERAYGHAAEHLRGVKE